MLRCVYHYTAFLLSGKAIPDQTRQCKTRQDNTDKAREYIRACGAFSRRVRPAREQIPVERGRMPRSRQPDTPVDLFAPPAQIPVGRGRMRRPRGNRTR